MSDTVPTTARYLVEWWMPLPRLEHLGRWIEADDPTVARSRALIEVAGAWTGRVRVSLLDHGRKVAAVDAGEASLEAWDVAATVLPASAAGPVLPPRSASDVRAEVVCGCRDALALALRARLLGKDQVVRLLSEIDRSFDPSSFEDPDMG